MTLPEINFARAPLPSSTNAAFPQQVASAKAPQQFTALLGMMLDENEPTPEPKTNKKQETDLASLPQSPAAPMPQPPIIPLMLKMHLAPPSATPAKSSKDQSDDSQASPSQGSVNTLAPTLIQLPAPLSTQAQTGLSEPPQNIKSAAQSSAQSPRMNSLTEETAATRLTVPDSDKPAAKSNFDLAFTAKITPITSTNQTTPETPVQPAPQVQTAPASIKPAAAVANQSDNTQVPATSQSQQSNQNSDDSLPRETKQPDKTQAKAAPAGVTQPQQQLQISSGIPQVPYATPIVEPTKTTTGIGPPDTLSERTHTSQPIDARPTNSDLPATASSSNSEPVRDLSLRLGNTPGNQVEVKIQERAGELHVAVLSSSPSLSTDLKQQVGDLIGKLDKAGYHAEALRQTVSSTASQNSNQTGAGQQDPSGRQQQERQQGQGRQKRSAQPQWLQEMNTTLGPAAVEGVNNQ